MTAVQLIIDTNVIDCYNKIMAALSNGYQVKSLTSKISMDAIETFTAILVKKV